MLSFPTHAEDFTVDWMNEALSASGHLGEYKVTQCEAVQSDIPGQTAEIVKINVTYNDPACELPTAFVAKVKSHNQAVIDATIRVYDLYRRETSFYREVPDVGIPVPPMFVCQHDPETQDLVMLMGDLSPAVSPSWAATTEQVEEAVSHLPAFHARWWNDASLRERDWLVQYDDKDFFFAAASAANMAIPIMDEAFGDRAEHTKQAMRLLLDKLDAIIAYADTRPYTFVHGDYHPKQMFFGSEAGGDFAVIDWQFPFVGQAAWDLIRITVLGLEKDVRKAKATQLFDQYHRELVSHGVSGYSREDLEDDIRLGLIVNQMIMSVALIDTDISLVERECANLGLDWQDVLLLRGESALRDWQVVDFIQSLGH